MLLLGQGSESRVRVLICQSEPTGERAKVSHVVVECRVINHHPRRGGGVVFVLVSRSRKVVPDELVVAF